MAVIIKIPQLLRKFIDENKEIIVSAGSIIEIIKEVKIKYPELAKEIVDSKNHIKCYLKLCVNEDFVKNPAEYNKKINDGQVLKLLVPISGG